jgi:hypothetical protein
VSHPPIRRPYSDASLQRQVIALLKTVTGRTISSEWAAKVIRHILAGKNPADPWRYIRGAILGSGDPVYEFMPISAPGYPAE